MSFDAVVVIIVVCWACAVLIFVTAINSIHQQDDGETVTKEVNP